MKKGLSLGLAIGGGILTVTGAALLGVGCNHTIKIETGENSYQVMGVGSQNYGKVIKAKVNGNDVPQEAIDAQNKLINETKPSYKDFLSQSKETYDKAKKEYDAAKKAGVPQEVLDEAKKAVD